MKRKSTYEKKKKLILGLVISLFMIGLMVGVLYLQELRPTETEKLTESENSSIHEDTIEEDAMEEENKEPSIQDFTMFFTGDVMLQNCKGVYEEKGINGIISNYLQQEMVSADMTMINNEFPFSTRGEKAPDKQFTFRVDPSYVSALLEMGVDVASLANNHALDFGVDALKDTFQTLDESGIFYVGAGETKERAERAAFVEAGGRKIGILSASRVIPVSGWNIDVKQPGLFCTYDSTRLVERIKEIEKQCDYVVVFVHWGIERNAYPEQYQRNLAQRYIDAGADLVVGNHSHVPQGIEYYKGVPIVYCLGNYIFNPNMTDTYALKVVWDTDGKTSLQVVPIDTKNYLTKELSGDEKLAFYQYLEEISFDVTVDQEGNVFQK